MRVVMVRDARPQDALAVAEVHVRSWQAAYRGLLPDGYLAALRAEDRAARYTFERIGGDDPATMVAVEGDVICGFVTTGPARGAGGNGGEVYGLYLDPRSWGAGVGRVLIARGRERLAGRGFSQAVLWVLAGNQRAERFYRADGWRLDGRRQVREVWGVSVCEVGYRRDLP